MTRLLLIPVLMLFLSSTPMPEATPIAPGSLPGVEDHVARLLVDPEWRPGRPGTPSAREEVVAIRLEGIRFATEDDAANGLSTLLDDLERTWPPEFDLQMDRSDDGAAITYTEHLTDPIPLPIPAHGQFVQDGTMIWIVVVFGDEETTLHDDIVAHLLEQPTPTDEEGMLAAFPDPTRFDGMSHLVPLDDLFAPEDGD